MLQNRIIADAIGSPNFQTRRSTLKELERPVATATATNVCDESRVARALLLSRSLRLGLESSRG